MGDFGAVDGHEHVSNKAIFSLVPSTILFLIAAILPSIACAEDAGAHDFLIREARRFDVVSARPAPSLAAPDRVAADARAMARKAMRTAAMRARIAQAKAAMSKAIDGKAIDLAAPDAAAATPQIVSPEAKMAALVSRFADETLRKGDIVATQAGLTVFRGASHFPYKPSDFAPFATAPRKQTQDLAAVDRALGGRSTTRKTQAMAGARTLRSDAQPRLAYAQSEQKLDVEKTFAGALKTLKPQAADAPARRLRVVGESYIY